MKPHIVVIGSTNTDMIIKVQHLPMPGETVLGGEFSTARGGKGANQAVAAARAGGRVTFISCVGNDLFGKSALEELIKDDIDTSAIKIVDGVSSGVALINVSSSGENSISVASGANSLLLPADIVSAADIIKSADIVLLQLEIPPETVDKVVELATEFNKTIILNPAPARHLDEALLKNVSIITPNEHEAAYLTNQLGAEDDYLLLANKLHTKGVSTVVITLGEKGAFYSQRQNDGLVPGFKVQAIDTTGAGDTFNGYLAVFLASGNDLPCAIKSANAAAALSVTRLGAQPSIPSYGEIKVLEHINA